MTRRALGLLLLLAAFLAAYDAAAQKYPSLTGSLYFYRGNTSTPLPGYRVYLYYPATQRWTYPALTDTYGRFAFYDLAPGEYLLRVYRSGDVKSQVWQQSVRVPSQLRPIVLR